MLVVEHENHMHTTIRCLSRSKPLYNVRCLTHLRTTNSQEEWMFDTYTPVNWHSNGKWTLWRCISLLKMGIFYCYCWWFRNPAPFEAGSLSCYLRGFIYIPSGWPWDFWTINSILVYHGVGDLKCLESTLLQPCPHLTAEDQGREETFGQAQPRGRLHPRTRMVW